MNRAFLLILLLVGITVNAQRRPKIKGNKNVVQVSEELPPFTAIELLDDLEISLVASRVEGYNIEADDNLLDVLKFKVVDSTLEISSFYNITSSKKLNIEVNYNILNSLTVKDGKVKTDNISTDYLYINTIESSKLDLRANADFVDLTMEGNSAGDFKIDTDSLNVVLRDRADVSIYAVSKANNIQLESNATAEIDGTTDILNATLMGNANLKAEKFKVVTANVIIGESSNMKVFASENFILNSSGSAKTNLYGNPIITITEFLDTSELHKEKG